MRASAVTAQHAGSGVTSPPSKDHYQFGGHGNVEDISNSNQDYSKDRFSDSVLTEIQLRSLLIDWKKSGGEFVALPVTLTNGDNAIANFNTSVWPAWIRSAIRQKLLDAGGVPSVSPLQIQRNSEGNPFVLPQMKPATKSPASTAEPVTEGVAPKSNPTSSSKPTALKPVDT